MEWISAINMNLYFESVSVLDGKHPISASSIKRLERELKANKEEVSYNASSEQKF
jgi:hypothetical protein